MKRGVALAVSLGVLWFTLSSGAVRSLVVHAQQATEQLKIVFVAGLKSGGNVLRTDNMYSSMYVRLSPSGSDAFHWMDCEPPFH